MFKFSTDRYFYKKGYNRRCLGDRVSRVLYGRTEPSFYPFAIACGVFLLAFSILVWMNEAELVILRGIFLCDFSNLSVFFWNIFIAALLRLFLGLSWSDDLWFEKMTGLKIKAYKCMFVLFICSEAMFFFGIFYARVFLELNRADRSWPPLGISTPHARGWATYGLFLLITSGWFVTWAQKSRVYKCSYNVGWGLVIGRCLGVCFLTIQYNEYSWLGFNINDGIFGSIFYFITGFHGFHVMVGLLMLWRICYYALVDGLIRWHGMRIIRWYWHFVDVIFIFVWYFMYWEPRGWK